MLTYKCTNILDLKDKNFIELKEFVLAEINLMNSLNNIQTKITSMASNSIDEILKDINISKEISNVLTQLKLDTSDDKNKRKIIDFVIKKSKLFKSSILVYSEQYRFIRAIPTKKIVQIYILLDYMKIMN